MAEALHSRGAHPWQLRVLLGALEDLDRGIVHPILKPAFKPASGPQHPTTHWEARASIVLALETRMALGEHKLMAANRVAREIRDALYANANARWNDDPAKLLLNWRDRLNRAGRGSAPRDGEHWDALEEGRAHIRHCDTLEPAERAAELHRFYKRTLGYALQLLAGQPLKARA